MPVMSMTTASGAALAEGWRRSVYSRIAAHPALAGITLPDDPALPFRLLAAGGGARSEILIDARGRFCGRSSIALGPGASAAAAAMAATLQLAPVRMPGAEIAWGGLGRVKPMYAPGATVAAGRGLLAIGEGMPARLSTPTPTSHHLELDVQSGTLVTALWPLAMASVPPADQPAAAMAQLIRERLVPKRISIELDLVPEGTRESATLAWSTGARLLEPIDPAAIASLPTDAMVIVAVGVSGSRAWSAIADPIIDALVADRAREKPAPTAKTLLAEIDQRLAEDGAPGGLRALIEGAGGTWALALVPSGSEAAVVVRTPRSPMVDRTIESMAVGATSAWRVELALGGEQVWAHRLSDGWWIASDPSLSPARRPSPLVGTLPSRTVGFLAVDTPALLRAASPAFAVLGATAGSIAEAAARLVGPQRIHATAEAGSIVIDSRGPLGVMPALLLGPVLVLPAIPMIRERASQGLANTIADDMLPMISVVLEEGAAGRQAPADLAALAPALAADPDADWHPARGRQGPLAYRYLRPVRIEALDHAVPVLVDDPALHRGMIMIAMGNGRIIVVRGEAAARIWAAAGRKPAGASWTANEARALLDGIPLPP